MCFGYLIDKEKEVDQIIIIVVARKHFRLSKSKALRVFLLLIVYDMMMMMMMMIIAA